MARLIRMSMFLVSGAAILATGCATQIRDVAFSTASVAIGEWLASFVTNYLPAAA